VSDGVRKHPRVARPADVVWAMESRQLSGRAKVVDISLSGACLKVDAAFVGDRGAVISLLCPSIPTLPTKARVQWTRRAPGQPYVLCGVAFEVQSGSAEWSRWFNANVNTGAALASAR
jgi:hypothetical protein